MKEVASQIWGDGALWPYRQKIRICKQHALKISKNLPFHGLLGPLTRCKVQLNAEIL